MKFLSKLALFMFPIMGYAKKANDCHHHELIEKFLPRLAAIESSGNPDAVGDKGKSLGLYQISKEAWRDSTDWARLNCPEWLSLAHFNGIGKDYKKDCMNPDTARWVATFYLMYLSKRIKESGYPVNMKTLYMAYNCGFSKANSFAFDMNHFAVSDKRRAIFIRASMIIDAQLTSTPLPK